VEDSGSDQPVPLPPSSLCPPAIDPALLTSDTRGGRNQIHPRLFSIHPRHRSRSSSTAVAHPQALVPDNGPKTKLINVSHVLLDPGDSKTDAREKPTDRNQTSTIISRRNAWSSYQSLLGFPACCDSCNDWRSVLSHRTSFQRRQAKQKRGADKESLYLEAHDFVQVATWGLSASGLHP
jgi:hypothetical protein